MSRSRGTPTTLLWRCRSFPGALDGIAGVYRESPDFEMDEAAVKAFDSTFPPKAPADMVPIDALLKRLTPPPAGQSRHLICRRSAG